MLRALSRLLGFLLLAAAFVGIVFDGARSIANNALRTTSGSDLAASLLRERYAAFEGAAHGPLWQYLGAPLATLPVAVLALLLGAVLLWLGQPPRDPFGGALRS